MEQELLVEAFDQVPFHSEEVTPFAAVDLAELGVDPREPTLARPGSDDKVLMLAARYASGLPLWHDADCSDHSRAQTNVSETEPGHLFATTSLGNSAFETPDFELANG